MLMIAASTADIISPPTNGLKSCLVITRSTVSTAGPDSGSVRYTLPTMPTKTAAIMAMIYQPTAMRLERFSSLVELIAMKRTRI